MYHFTAFMNSTTDRLTTLYIMTRTWWAASLATRTSGPTIRCIGHPRAAAWCRNPLGRRLAVRLPPEIIVSPTWARSRAGGSTWWAADACRRRSRFRSVRGLLQCKMAPVGPPFCRAFAWPAGPFPKRIVRVPWQQLCLAAAASSSWSTGPTIRHRIIVDYVRSSLCVIMCAPDWVLRLWRGMETDQQWYGVWHDQQWYGVVKRNYSPKKGEGGGDIMAE